MRRYIFGLIAAVIAAGASAFTTPKKPVDMYVFQFNGSVSGGYSVANVENEANTHWQYQGKNLSLCGGQDEKACRIAVIDSYVDNPASPTQLNNFTIGATLSGSTAHVSSITDSGNNQYSNQRD
ncbi:hypothetical protein [Terrimonas alba]|uniref:hypothetical protein n=1 Tax=Terrimonas alba TaxID=3349636 RepID=UPI0035F4699C